MTPKKSQDCHCCRSPGVVLLVLILASKLLVGAATSNVSVSVKLPNSSPRHQLYRKEFLSAGSLVKY